MRGQSKIDISEQKPLKFTALTDGYEMVSNDATVKILLRRITVMDGFMESGFYSTKLWIKEDNGWIEANNTKNYTTKEEFITDMEGSEDFTQALRDYRQWKENTR